MPEEKEEDILERMAINMADRKPENIYVTYDTYVTMRELAEIAE